MQAVSRRPLRFGLSSLSPAFAITTGIAWHATAVLRLADGSGQTA
jgi:hypothetical protein